MESPTNQILEPPTNQILESPTNQTSESSINQFSDSPINQFYRNKSIFITGATGFIGKVLCEKLLGSCPDIGNIYILLRSRNGKSSQERLNDLLQSKVFTLTSKKLKVEKLIAVNGDISAPGLGLSSQDRDTLIASVSVVFHSAASVKFHGPLKDFIEQNVYGTRETMKLCREMTKLEAMVYVSTAYANCCLREIEERVYPLALSAQETINKINCIESLSVNAPITMELLEGRPNSYTFSKALAENLVQEMTGDMPVVIVRPSIVTPALNEPIPGWVDNMNGVAGTLLLGSLGIARTMEVDLISNSLIAIGWHTATFPSSRKKVVHLTSGTLNPVTWGNFLDYSREAAMKAPSIKMVRPLARNPTSASGVLGRMNHLLTKYISHILFAYLVDFILVLFGYKKLMVRVTLKMHRAFAVLEHFTNKEWSFHNDNYLHIHSKMSDQDKRTFFSDIREINWREYAHDLYMGTRRYLLKEDDSNIEQAHKRLQLICFAYLLFQLILAALLFYTIVYPIGVTISNFVTNSCSNDLLYTFLLENSTIKSTI